MVRSFDGVPSGSGLVRVGSGPFQRATFHRLFSIFSGSSNWNSDFMIHTCALFLFRLISNLSRENPEESKHFLSTFLFHVFIDAD